MSQESRPSPKTAAAHATAKPARASTLAAGRRDQMRIVSSPLGVPLGVPVYSGAPEPLPALVTVGVSLTPSLFQALELQGQMCQMTVSQVISALLTEWGRMNEVVPSSEEPAAPELADTQPAPPSDPPEPVVLDENAPLATSTSEEGEA